MIDAPPAPRPEAPARSTATTAWLRTAGEVALVSGLCLVTFWKGLDDHFLAGDYDWLSLAKFGEGELDALRGPHSSYRRYGGEVFTAIYHLCGEESAFRYRLLLLFLHIANAVLAGKLVSRILGRPGAAWIAAALFAVAPASSEAIHSIAAFAYPIASLLLLSGLLLYDRAVTSGTVAPWAGAVVCFGLALPLREHALAALPIAALLEWLRGGGAAFKTRGPWLRLGTPIAIGLAVLVVRSGWEGLPSVPTSPDYNFDGAMPERLLVTLQRLVLPPVPLDFQQYAAVHKGIGFALLTLVVGVIVLAPPGDRKCGVVLLLAMFVALAPFLPVSGDHIRQRFAYFGTVFAAGVATYLLALASERISPRVSLPIVLAMLAGLLLEQQAEFERDYIDRAEESRARAQAYRMAAPLVRDDDIAIFAGDRDPSLVSSRSTIRVLTGFERRQLVLVKASDPDELHQRIERLRQETNAKGHMRLYVRGKEGYDYVRIADLAEGVDRVFAIESPGSPGPRTFFVLLPRAHEDASRPGR